MEMGGSFRFNRVFIAGVVAEPPLAFMSAAATFPGPTPEGEWLDPIPDRQWDGDWIQWLQT